MSTPLLRCSSKPATIVPDPAVGQAQGSSSSPGGAGVGVTGGRLATTGAGGWAALAALAALVAEAGETGAGTITLGVTGRATATSVPAAPGGTTRSTWPTSMMLGFSMLFQRATSRQFWPLSRAMRINVSPGRTV